MSLEDLQEETIAARDSPQFKIVYTWYEYMIYNKVLSYEEYRKKIHKILHMKLTNRSERERERVERKERD